MRTLGAFAITLGRIRTIMAENPEAVVAAVAATLVIAGGVYTFLRLRRPDGELLRRLLADRDEIAILLHPNPDPDAMASGLGVASLAEQLGVDTTILYPGQIRHQENRAFRTVLNLELTRLEHVTDITAEDVILVDHNEPRGFTGADGVLPVAVIDHHPGDGAGQEFTDVRTNYGATASIVTEYFKDIRAKPVPPDAHAVEVGAGYTLSTQAATGLLYGILSDTNDLTVGADGSDFDAAGFLYPGVDQNLLDRIANPSVDAEVLEVKAKAIAGRQVEGSFAVSDVGAINSPDSIPQAADELIQLEGVTAVIVIGKRDDTGTVHLSGRSRDDRVHMGRTLQGALAEVPHAGAGGHARMGGAQIDPKPVPTQRVADGGVDRGLDRQELTRQMFSAMQGDL
jgi:Exopolyphosphatase-related proteins